MASVLALLPKAKGAAPAALKSLTKERCADLLRIALKNSKDADKPLVPFAEYFKQDPDQFDAVFFLAKPKDAIEGVLCLLELMGPARAAQILAKDRDLFAACLDYVLAKGNGNVSSFCALFENNLEALSQSIKTTLVANEDKFLQLLAAFEQNQAIKFLKGLDNESFNLLFQRILDSNSIKVTKIKAKATADEVLARKLLGSYFQNQPQEFSVRVNALYNPSLPSHYYPDLLTFLPQAKVTEALNGVQGELLKALIKPALQKGNGEESAFINYFIENPDAFKAFLSGFDPEKNEIEGYLKLIDCVNQDEITSVLGNDKRFKIYLDHVLGNTKNTLLPKLFQLQSAKFVERIKAIETAKLMKLLMHFEPAEAAALLHHLDTTQFGQVFPTALSAAAKTAEKTTRILSRTRSPEEAKIYSIILAYFELHPEKFGEKLEALYSQYKTPPYSETLALLCDLSKVQECLRSLDDKRRVELLNAAIKESSADNKKLKTLIAALQIFGTTESLDKDQEAKELAGAKANAPEFNVLIKDALQKSAKDDTALTSFIEHFKANPAEFTAFLSKFDPEKNEMEGYLKLINSVNGDKITSVLENEKRFKIYLDYVLDNPNTSSTLPKLFDLDAGNFVEKIKAVETAKLLRLLMHFEPAKAAELLHPLDAHFGQVFSTAINAATKTSEKTRVKSLLGTARSDDEAKIYNIILAYFEAHPEKFGEKLEALYLNKKAAPYSETLALLCELSTKKKCWESINPDTRAVLLTMALVNKDDTKLKDLIEAIKSSGTTENNVLIKDALRKSASDEKALEPFIQRFKANPDEFKEFLSKFDPEKNEIEGYLKLINGVNDNEIIYVLENDNRFKIYLDYVLANPKNSSTLSLLFNVDKFTVRIKALEPAKLQKLLLILKEHEAVVCLNNLEDNQFAQIFNAALGDKSILRFVNRTDDTGKIYTLIISYFLLFPKNFGDKLEALYSQYKATSPAAILVLLSGLKTSRAVCLQSLTDERRFELFKAALKEPTAENLSIFDEKEINKFLHSLEEKKFADLFFFAIDAIKNKKGAKEESSEKEKASFSFFISYFKEHPETFGTKITELFKQYTLFNPYQEIFWLLGKLEEGVAGALESTTETGFTQLVKSILYAPADMKELSKRVLVDYFKQYPGRFNNRWAKLSLEAGGRSLALEIFHSLKEEAITAAVASLTEEEFWEFMEIWKAPKGKLRDYKNVAKVFWQRLVVECAKKGEGTSMAPAETSKEPSTSENPYETSYWPSFNFLSGDEKEKYNPNGSYWAKFKSFVNEAGK
jgi:hypothetical protein